MTVSAANTLSRPAPRVPGARVAAERVPAGIAAVLHIVTTLLQYGTHLVATLEHRAVRRGFATIAQFFGTATVAKILLHLQRGILRAEALHRLLLARALRGRDIGLPAAPRQPRRPAQPAAQPLAPRPPRRRGPKPPLTPDTMPTPDQLDAEVRRRPIGRTLAAICADLGVAPSLCQAALWNEIFDAIYRYGGSLPRLVLDQYNRSDHYIRREIDHHRELGRPEQTEEGIRRAVGFFIGEPPVDPFGAMQPAVASPAFAAPRPP